MNNPISAGIVAKMLNLKERIKTRWLAVAGTSESNNPIAHSLHEEYLLAEDLAHDLTKAHGIIHTPQETWVEKTSGRKPRERE